MKMEMLAVGDRQIDANRGNELSSGEDGEPYLR